MTLLLVVTTQSTAAEPALAIKSRPNAAAPTSPAASGLVLWLKAESISPTDPTQVRVDGDNTYVKRWADQSQTLRAAAAAGDGKPGATEATKIEPHDVA